MSSTCIVLFNFHCFTQDVIKISLQLKDFIRLSPACSLLTNSNGNHTHLLQHLTTALGLLV